MFLTHLFFGIVTKGLSDRDAWKRAVEATDHPEVYGSRYFDSSRSEPEKFAPRKGDTGGEADVS